MPKISELPALAQATSGDVIPIVDDSGNITKKVTADKVVPNGSVTNSQLANDAVDTAQIADDAVTADKIDFGGSGAGIWWEEIGRATLSSNGDVMTVSSLPSRKYLKLEFSTVPTGGTNAIVMTFNGDTGANYSIRASGNGGAADGIAPSVNNLGLSASTSTQPHIGSFEVLNVANREKYVIGESVSSASGAAATVERRRFWAKWVNTSNAISSITLTNVGTGDFAAGSEVVVLGHN